MLIDKPNKAYSMNTESYRKEITENGVTKSVSVEKVENGYIVVISKWGRPDGKEDAEYIDETKKYISKDNPFDDKSKDETPDPKGLLESMGMGDFGLI